MLLRTITGFIMLAALIAILFIGEIALGVVVAFFTIIGIKELYNVTETGGNKPVKWVSFLFAIPVILYSLDSRLNYFSVSVYCIAAIVFFICILKNEKYTVVDAIITLISGIVVSNMFFCILAIYKVGDTKAKSAMVLVLILIGACVTDVFAYLVGVTIGKHKLCPAISPKKSIEGSIGGMLGVTIAMAGFGYFVLNKNVEEFAKIPIYAYIILGLICGVVSQIGDLAASMIKRYYNIKDFGKIFPGHGGILDRFDSFTFVAPVIYFFVMSAPVIFK